MKVIFLDIDGVLNTSDNMQAMIAIAHLNGVPVPALAKE
jgi:histidinol phosphatase-like enzyme